MSGKRHDPITVQELAAAAAEHDREKAGAVDSGRVARLVAAVLVAAFLLGLAGIWFLADRPPRHAPAPMGQLAKGDRLPVAVPR